MGSAASLQETRFIYKFLQKLKLFITDFMSENLRILISFIFLRLIQGALITWCNRRSPGDHEVYLGHVSSMEGTVFGPWGTSKLCVSLCGAKWPQVSALRAFGRWATPWDSLGISVFTLVKIWSLCVLQRKIWALSAARRNFWALEVLMRNVRALSVFLRWNRQQAAIVSGAGQGPGTVVHPHQIEASRRRCLTYSNNRSVSRMYYAVLRIRIRDPLPFCPLDPGSEIGFFRIPDPKPIFLSSYRQLFG